MSTPDRDEFNINQPEIESPAEQQDTDTGSLVMDKKTWHETVEQAVETATTESARSGDPLQPLAVLFMDVDHFKDVNDQLGHNVGDKVIADLRQIIVNNLRTKLSRPEAERDKIAISGTGFQGKSRWPADAEYVPGHIGGDEFAVLCQAGEKGARALIERLKAAVSEYEDVDISISIGIAVLQPNMDASQLMMAADQDMYADKLRQLPPLAPEIEEKMTEFIKLWEENKLRIRDLGKYILLATRKQSESQLGE